jgi:hypothetical protein
MLYKETVVPERIHLQEMSIMTKELAQRISKTTAKAALAATIGFSGANLATTTEAFADPSCYGDYCSGQDPEATHCVDGSAIVATDNNEYSSVQLKWSPTCKTNWAKLVVYPTGKFHTFNHGLLTAQQDTGYTQSLTVPMAHDNSEAIIYWTPMIYSPDHCVKAMFNNQLKSYDLAETACV